MEGVRRSVSQSPVAIHRIWWSGLAADASAEKEPRTSALLPVARRIGEIPASVFFTGWFGKPHSLVENACNNQTGVVFLRCRRGVYDFTLDCHTAFTERGESVLTVLPEQLGLELKLLDNLVIDSAEKPSEN